MVSRKSKVALQVLIERRTRFAQLTKLDRKTATEMTNTLNIVPAFPEQRYISGLSLSGNH